MSDIQEKKDTVLKKLTKAQQKKLSLQEQIEYLKKGWCFKKYADIK